MLGVAIGGLKLGLSILQCMNKSILISLGIAGTRFKIGPLPELPMDRPLIVISNHQSMYDVPLIMLVFRKHFPRFIAKKELGRWIPSISFALRNLGSVLIDRADQNQSIHAISEFARDVAAKNHTACIFPEGTRARQGEMKKFKMGGLATLLKEMPNALIVPVVLDGSWQILRYNFKPVPFGCKVYLNILAPIEPQNMNEKEIGKIAQERILLELNKLRSTQKI